MSHVVVVCAMESEAVHLRLRMRDVVEEPLHHWRRSRGQIGDCKVDIVVAGIGMVNAAAATTAACVSALPDVILNYGCAGAHLADIRVGDVVIADRVAHVSSLIVLPDGTRRYTGFRVPVAGEVQMLETLPADPDLLGRARAVTRQHALPTWPGLEQQPVVHVGCVASADIWTQNAELIQELHDTHGSLCEDMEAAAIAQVAAYWRIPFLSIKDISNNELQSFSDLGLPEGYVLAHVEEEVGKRAALVMEQVLLTS